MPDSRSRSTAGPSPGTIERPHCAKCHNRMMLARIMPGPAGYDQRNFECGRCDHVLTLTVANDPMNFDSMGWLAGELKGPT